MNTNQKTGSIRIVLGCMYSGKTSEVIKECKKWYSISRNAVCVNYEGDNRYGNDENLYSHDLNKIKCVKTGELKQVDIEVIKTADIVLINEGQFFGDLLEYCLLWAEVYNKNIIVSGLDGDYLRNPFGKILDLIPYADSVTKLHAFCSYCANGTRAYFTKRITKETDQKVIGGEDKYKAVCRYHYLIDTNNIEDVNNVDDSKN